MPDAAARLSEFRARQAELNERSCQLFPRIATGPKDVVEPLRALAVDAEALEREVAGWSVGGHDDPGSRELAGVCGPPMLEMLRQLLVFTYSGIGGALSMLGEPEAAAAAYAHALALTEGRNDPERGVLFESVGKNDFQCGKYDEAEAAFGQALAVYEEFARPEAWVDRAGAGPGFSAEERATLATRSGEGVARTHGYLSHVALARGDRDGYGRALERAYTEAKRFGQTLLMRTLWRQKYEYALRWDVTGTTLDAMNDEIDNHRLPELEADENYTLDVLLLRAQGLAEREGFGRAESQLKAAVAKAGDRPRERWTSLMAYARFCGDRPGRVGDGIGFAREALAVGEATGIAGFTDTARQTLIGLYLDAGDAGNRAKAVEQLGPLLSAYGKARDAERFARSLLQLATARFLDGEYDDALTRIDTALQVAPDVSVRAAALTARGATLQRLGRNEEALAAAVEALALYPDRPGRSPDDPPTAWRDEMRHVEALHAAAAVISARLGRTAEAFGWAERGKGRLLRRRRQLANLPAGPPAPEGLGPIREALAADPAALVMFSVGPSETAVFLLTPGSDEPRVEFAPVGESDLKAMLPAAGDGWQKWNASLSAAVPRLSDALLRPLTALREAVAGYKTLYIVPDSHLYGVPFAALSFGDGVPLVEHCALAVVPSASALVECRARRPRSEKTCLAAGFGSSEGIEFAPHARAVADEFAGELGWGSGAEFLSETDATPARWLAEAPRFRVLHLACHGGVGGVMDTLAASVLRLKGGDLSARDLIRPGGAWLGAELVFLNACRSAGFRMRLGGEVGGFWQAFLEAGVPSTVATLFYVDPTAADALARDFYRNWLGGDGGGVSKAEALRRAQLSMSRRGVNAAHWASHVLIGDHR